LPFEIDVEDGDVELALLRQRHGVFDPAGFASERVTEVRRMS